MVRRGRKIMLLLLLVGAIHPIAARAKTSSQNRKNKTVRGLYCGQNAGSSAGEFSFRVGKKVMVFTINFGQDSGNATLIGFNINNTKVGEEFVIKYYSIGDNNGDGVDDGEDHYGVFVKATGRRRKIAPCRV